ncbi:MAG: DUF3833 domain-containing protein [Oceanicoccus sp.]|uniref:DUF3833 domain-containing protein n=1 Tax=Oceanicoccus sp. TaxID=2691044 RepID=UPI0026367BC7|nr:DUF3833 domain-containing protein [Oceanicoccus sp.]MDG1771839.1 DUF3833 domain-containing protein [Oceanicoccus sp.]
MFVSPILKVAGLLPLMVLLLASCNSVDVIDYKNNQPKLVAESFFDGQLRAAGVLKDRSGKVIRYFTADIKAYWKEGVGTLEEDFVFDDGEKQRRVWTLTPNGDNRYIGTAGDVIGESDIQVAGNSMFLGYVLRIPYGDGTIDITIDDRMYLVSENVLMNESSMSKFGVNVGQLLLVIQKVD